MICADMSKMHRNNKADDPKTQREEALRAVEFMRQLEAKHKKKMKTIRLKDGTIVSSTSKENLKQYIENDKKVLRVGY